MRSTRFHKRAEQRFRKLSRKFKQEDRHSLRINPLRAEKAQR